jgi:Cu(I)-responsive transcriptional regulator
VNIGQAAQAAGVSAKMIRHYEAIGLIPQADRQSSGYRDYSGADVHRLRFVRRGRELGFSIARIRDLLKLWSDQGRSKADVRRVALAHVTEMEEKAAKLQEMIDTLKDLAKSCAKEDSKRGLSRENLAHCPIISELGGGQDEAPPQTSRRTSRH